MAEQQDFTPTAPDYKGKMDVAAWKKKDKNGKEYLSVQIATKVNLFKNEPKRKD